MTTTAAGGPSGVTRPDGAAVATTGPREVEVLGTAIDTIVQVEAAIRKLTALRTVLLDAAHRLVPAAEAALLSPASPTAQGPALSARAELAERALSPTSRPRSCSPSPRPARWSRTPARSSTTSPRRWTRSPTGPSPTGTPSG